MEGDIEEVNRTMRITEIRVRYRLAVPRDKQEVAERSLEFHPSRCPAYQSVKDAIRIKISADFRWV